MLLFVQLFRFTFLGCCNSEEEIIFQLKLGKIENINPTLRGGGERRKRKATVLSSGIISWVIL